MANDDDNSNEGESSPAGESPPRRTTVLGMGLRPPGTPAPPKPELSALKKKLQLKLGSPPKPKSDVQPPRPFALQPKSVTQEPAEDEFEDEKTQLGAGLAEETNESDDAPIHDAAAAAEVSEASDFEDERTQLGEMPSFEAAAQPEDADDTQGLSSDWVATAGAAPGEELDALADWGQEPVPVGLDEESLPEAIRQRVPTYDQLPVVPARAGLSPVDTTQPGLPARSPDESGAGMAYFGDNTTISASDFETEKTEMLDSPFSTDPSVAKLVALEGPALGQEFFASAIRNTVGRGTNNTIVVPDLAMSRQHFEVNRTADDCFALVDLQSINGTALNGSKVREADLFHGDRLEAGKSVFQFVVSGAAPASRQRRVVPAARSTMSGQSMPIPVANGPAGPHPNSINRILIAISTIAVLVSLALVVLLVMHKMQANEGPDSSPEAGAVYLLGVEAVKARNWDQAQAQFERAKGIDNELEGVDGQLRRIEIERVAAKAVGHARELMERKQHDEAVVRAEEVPRDSVYRAEALELVREARKLAIVSLYQEAQEAVADENLDQARRLVALILERIPTHQGAISLQERLGDIEPFDFENEEQDSAEHADATAKSNAAKPKSKKRSTSKSKSDDWGFELVGSKSGKKRKKSSSGSAKIPNMTKGFMLYRTRKFDAALTFFNEQAAAGGPAAKSAKKFAGAVKEFSKSYPAGMAAYQSGKWAVAKREFTAAKRADSAIGDYFDKELKKKLATVEANLGLKQLAKGDAVGARKSLDRAKRHNSSDATVTNLGKELVKKARSLYVQANHARKTDPAKAGELCRQIKKIVPPSNETHQNAAKLLKSL